MARIFLDGGDPNDTRAVIAQLGFLDGQTTNPTLIAKNPEVRARLEHGERFQREELLEFYRGVVADIATLIPNGSVSIEVYADRSTTAEDMLAQAREMFAWIPNAHIKFPITAAGLTAAAQAIAEGMRVNMTLCFTQAQAAAVHAATRGAAPGAVFVSPFVGRLDDRGENGMQLIEHILRMHREAVSHVQVLTASVRNIAHLMYALQLGSDIITAPRAVLEQWGAAGMPMPNETFAYDAGALREIPFQSFDLAPDWRSFNISHELTEQGIDRFANDWNLLMA